MIADRTRPVTSGPASRHVASRAIACLALAGTLSGCIVTSTPPAPPPPEAANVNIRSMSLAAQRFYQFCVETIGTPQDGVDAANAFYGSTPLPSLGNLKLSASSGTEDIGVQAVPGTDDCRVTTSNGKTPNGPAEAVALANLFAARNQGTVSLVNRAGKAGATVGGRSFAFTYGVSGATSGVYFDLDAGR